MADPTSTRPDPTAQFRVRGYVLTEDNQTGLRDLFLGMNFTAEVIEAQDRAGQGSVDMTGNELGALLRSFARLGNTLTFDAPFTSAAPIRSEAEQ
ncbi:hypothetical protein [Porphyrobacter sp. YT40]|uniref:hypothetical protein n=1 Tax=Porphyrobacter sp. YT40 TaxID=2547601 RepID=UPI001143C62D|nr:hypothetical protein [Porphyrobacter sp. YT40]QDH33995.1 hypothetical protein E2E27_06390 [Porphyrobacter sp. YT40]